VVLAFSEVEGSGYTRLTLRRESPGLARARLPVVSGGRLSYYVEALAPSGVALGQAGEHDEPRVLELPEVDRPGPLDLEVATTEDPGSSTILEEWWFWSAVAVVVGAGVGAYFVFGPPSQGPSAGSLGQGALE